MTWDGIVTKFHLKYAKEIGLTTKIEAYIQYILPKKTLEIISFEYRRGCRDEGEERQEYAANARIGKDKPPKVEAREEVLTANKI